MTSESHHICLTHLKKHVFKQTSSDCLSCTESHLPWRKLVLDRQDTPAWHVRLPGNAGVLSRNWCALAHPYEMLGKSMRCPSFVAACHTHESENCLRLAAFDRVVPGPRIMQWRHCSHNAYLLSKAPPLPCDRYDPTVPITRLSSHGTFLAGPGSTPDKGRDFVPANNQFIHLASGSSSISEWWFPSRNTVMTKGTK